LGQLGTYERLVTNYARSAKKDQKELGSIVTKFLTRCEVTNTLCEQCRNIFRNYQKLTATRDKLLETSKILSEKLFNRELVQQMSDFMSKQAQKLCG
jgi:hypothetical protein